jgi:hypothetical protein
MHPRIDRKLLGLAVITTIFSIGHHVDHIVRGNHVGWPLIAQVTPFTLSLGFYPVIAIGFYLYARGRVGPGFWAILSLVGVLFVGLLHFGPWAVEPPRDILSPYRSAVAGWFALGWLVVFLILLLVTTIYSARLWLRRRLAGSA